VICYEFEDVKTGERVEVWMSADDCVPIGDTRKIEGRELRRLAAYGPGMVEPDWAHTTYQFHEDDCRKYGPKDRLGRPRALDEAGGMRLNNRREINEMRDRMAADGRSDGYSFGQFQRQRRRSR